MAYTNSGAASLSRGDVVCLDAANAGAGNVIKATPTALAAAGSVLGVVNENGPRTTGQSVVIADSTTPTVAQATTGLSAAGVRSLVAVNDSARLIAVTRPNGSEFIVGTCTANGDMVVQPRASRDTSPQHVYNVCSYGAAGDGVTDDRATFSGA